MNAPDRENGLGAFFVAPQTKGGVMDFDLLVERLTDRLKEWRAEARDLHQRGFDFEATALDACANDIEADLKSVNTTRE